MLGLHRAIEASQSVYRRQSKTAGQNKYNPTKPSSFVKSHTPMEWQLKKIGEKMRK